MKISYEQGQLDKKWIDQYCRNDWENCVRYWMEESGHIHPDSMLPDGNICEKLK